MEKDPSNNPVENQAQEQEYLTYEEHMARMNNESSEDSVEDIPQDNGENIPQDSPEQSGESIKTPEQRQVEDLEVLFSFCDKEDIVEILKSDSYGTLLENNVSLVDLFNANALFDEQYSADGYTSDYEWRGEDDPRNVFHLIEIDKGRFSNDPMTKVRLKQDDHDRLKEKTIRYKYYLEQNKKWDLIENKSYIYDEDIIRAKEAKATISEITNLYFSDNSSSEKTAMFEDVIQTRASGEDLSEEQKTFLTNEHNMVADRLLYNGKVVNEERAANISRSLDYAIDEFAKKNGEIASYDYARLLGPMLYAKSSIDDFLKAGRQDLVYKTQEKLADMVDDYFDMLVTTKMEAVSGGDINRFDTIDSLVFGYSNPYLIDKRAEEFNLCREYDWDENKYVIKNPDRIVDYMASGSIILEAPDSACFISENVKSLKELGISDEAILRNCNNLDPSDFISAESWTEGSGSRLVEAGIDRKKIIREVFSSYYFNQSYPFDKNNNYIFKNESYVDVLERNGFDITDIAETFSPDMISRDLKKFIERGADAKELMEYMASYREAADYTDSNCRVVWDKNHPEGRKLMKNKMLGLGIDYIAINLDTFVENGVTEEDIINVIDGDSFAPYGYLIPRMIESGKFDTQKILNLGFNKYTEHLKEMEKVGISEFVYGYDMSSPSDYYSIIIEQMSDANKEKRDNYYKDLAEEPRS